MLRASLQSSKGCLRSLHTSATPFVARKQYAGAALAAVRRPLALRKYATSAEGSSLGVVSVDFLISCRRCCVWKIGEVVMVVSGQRRQTAARRRSAWTYEGDKQLNEC